MGSGAPVGGRHDGWASCVQGLHDAIDGLLGIDIASLADGDVDKAVIALEQVTQRLAAARAGFTSEWCARRRWATDGSKSAKARLAREGGLSPAAAGAEVRRARKLRGMPRVAQAFAAGAISAEHVDLLGRCAITKFRHLFERDEGMLVAHAKHLRFPQLVRAVNHWLVCAADATDTSDERVDAQHGARRAHLSTAFAGTVALDALLDPVGGEIFGNELRRLEQQLFEADWAEARERVGPAATPDDLLRTAAQRRADALVEMARRSHACPDGVRGRRPLITILWGADSFRATLCETERGIVLNPRQVIPLLDEADIERIVFGAGSRVLDVGKRERFFTGALRRALEVRDRHCQHPAGCDVPSPDCQGDHIDPYAEGGLTTQEDGRMYCPVHNRTRHRRRPPPDTG